MDGFAAVIASVGTLSLVVTKTVDFIRNLVDKDDSAPTYVWNLAALGVGLGFALGWQIDLSASVAALVPALAVHADRLSGIAGQVLTGFALGAAAGFWHELLDALSGVASRAHAAAGQ